jgi:flagellar biosynthesis/type III secretory pathway protein FliH
MRPALDVAREWLKRKRMSTAEGIVWIEDRAPTGGIGFLPGQREHESLAALIESERAEAYRDGFEAARESGKVLVRVLSAETQTMIAEFPDAGFQTRMNELARSIAHGMSASLESLRPPAEAKEPGR